MTVNTKTEAGKSVASKALASLRVRKAAAPQTVRIGQDVVDRLMQMVSELVLTRNQLLQLKRNAKTSLGLEFDASLQRLNNITSSLQEGVMKTHMQSIDSLWVKFPALIRSLSKEFGKNIELRMHGGDTQLDKQTLEAIKGPLTYIIDNAIDSIETPRSRLRKGKWDKGVITLSAYHESGHIIIKVSDDGKGLDNEKIKAKAIKKGIIAEASEISDKQLHQLIFKPGFSINNKARNSSANDSRMDIVQKNIEAVNGTVDVASRLDKGTEFTIKLPMTHAIMPVLVFEVAGQVFGLPQIRVHEIVKVDKEFETINNTPALNIRGKAVPVVSVSDVFKLNRAELASEGFAIVCDMGSKVFGLLVDRVFHSEEIVIKPKIPMFMNLEVYSGSVILGDGNVVMIVEPSGILKASGITVSVETKVQKAKSSQDEDISFMTFTDFNGAIKAAPVELIKRIEEIDLSKAEYSGVNRVILNHGDLMRLVNINGDVPVKGLHNVIIFAENKKLMGLVVKNVGSIIRSKMEVKTAASTNGVVCSIVINGLSADVVDVGYYFSREFDDGSKPLPTVTGSLNKNRKTANGHVLLVDDSSFFRKFMGPVLMAANYKVTTCENGLEALKLLEKKPEEYSLVITDIDMPVMNGVEFILNSKTNSKIKKIPFIALTSHEDKLFEKAPTKDLGFAAYIPKSERDKIIGVIDNMLKITRVKDKRKANG